MEFSDFKDRRLREMTVILDNYRVLLDPLSKIFQSVLPLGDEPPVRLIQGFLSRRCIFKDIREIVA